MRLNPCSKLCKSVDLNIGQTDFAASLGAVHPLCATTGNSMDDDALLTGKALDDLTGGRSDNEVIRVGCAGDHRLTQPRIGLDDRLASLAGQRIGGEEDAGNCCINHTLNDNREAHGALINPKMVTVPDRAVRPKRGPAFSHRIENGLGADDVEIGLLLPSEARTREV